MKLMPWQEDVILKRVGLDGLNWVRELMETAVEDAPAQAPAVPAEEKPREEADIDKENARDTGAPPPEDGLCRNCRNRRPLNRHKLCYPCWVEDEIKTREKKEGRDWKPGDSHPDWCRCEGLGEHKNDDGTSRGMN